MTATDMVSVIAAAILDHWAETIAAEDKGFWVKCRCGEIGEVESDAEDWEPANKWMAAHQAGAVLAAISEAGAVEWGTEHVAQGSRTIEIHPCDSEADAQGAIAYYGGRTLSSITGPWEPVKAVSE